MTQVLPAIQNRRSYRKFKNQPVEDDKLKAVLTAAMYSPSAMHKRQWQFVVVTDPDKIKQLSKMKPGGGHVGQAPVVIAVTSQDWKHWLEDASIVAAHIYLEATHQGLGTCWTNVRDSKTWLRQDAEEFVRDVLELDQNERVLCLLPLGYPAEDKAPHAEEEFEKDKVRWLKASS